jgi:hypothetical protein
VRWIFVLGGIGLLADHPEHCSDAKFPGAPFLNRYNRWVGFKIVVLCFAVVIVRRVFVRASAPRKEPTRKR